MKLANVGHAPVVAKTHNNVAKQNKAVAVAPKQCCAPKGAAKQLNVKG